MDVRNRLEQQSQKPLCLDLQWADDVLKLRQWQDFHGTFISVLVNIEVHAVNHCVWNWRVLWEGILSQVQI